MLDLSLSIINSCKHVSQDLFFVLLAPSVLRLRLGTKESDIAIFELVHSVLFPAGTTWIVPDHGESDLLWFGSRPDAEFCFLLQWRQPGVKVLGARLLVSSESISTSRDITALAQKRLQAGILAGHTFEGS